MSSATAELFQPPGMTLQEWADMDEDEPGELVDGLLVEEELPSFLHEAIVAWFVRTLGAWAVPRRGWVFGSEAKYALSPKRGRKPDASVYLAGARKPAARASISTTPPSLLIEVVSSRPRDARRDRVEKLTEYAAFGVPFYWLVYPELRLVEILELGADGRYAIALSASEGTHAAPGCDELTLDLDALWSELDRFAAEEGSAPEPEDDAPSDD